MKTRISRLLFSLSILSLLFSGGVPLSYAHAIQPAAVPGLLDDPIPGPTDQPAPLSLDQKVYLPLVVAPLATVRPVKIAAGGSHNCALTESKAIRCWGLNDFGQLGNGTTIDRSRPVDVVGLSSKVTAIAAGRYRTCALTAGGGVKCWGSTSAGQLGDSPKISYPFQRLAPVDVVGLSKGVVAVAAGLSHTCALTESGGVKCWGYNYFGEIGDGTHGNIRYTPVDVSGLTDAAAIAAGWEDTCALTRSGDVKCWGQNDWGQLGDGTTSNRDAPVAVTGLSGQATAISAGWYHTCALTRLGGVKCWEIEYTGRRGDGIGGATRRAPVDVAGLLNGMQAISANGGHTCALTENGSLKCWGANEKGQLGDGTTKIRLKPVNVSALLIKATTATARPAEAYLPLVAAAPATLRARVISAGWDYTCALTASGGARCWGSNEYGQLGDGTTTQRLAPVDIPGLAGGLAAIVSGDAHTCALTAGGGVKCWGFNQYGQLGDGTAENRVAPVDVVGLSSGVTAIAVGGLHTCAMTAIGGVKCWGRNDYGQLGDGTTTNRSAPADVVGLSSGIRAIAAGEMHTCVLTESGGVKCWGHNLIGQLGNGAISEQPSPLPSNVSGLASGVAAIAAGGYDTCALTTGGGVKCWGSNDVGQLGDGSTAANRLAPVDVLGLSSGAVAIAAENYRTCALTTTGDIKCWGAGQHTPVDVSGLDGRATAISVGGSHTCVLTASEGVQCWGFNDYGQLGDGTTITRPTPVDVIGFGGALAH